MELRSSGREYFADYLSEQRVCDTCADITRSQRERNMAAEDSSTAHRVGYEMILGGVSVLGGVAAGSVTVAKSVADKLGGAAAADGSTEERVEDRET